MTHLVHFFAVAQSEVVMGGRAVRPGRCRGRGARTPESTDEGRVASRSRDRDEDRRAPATSAAAGTRQTLYCFKNAL